MYRPREVLLKKDLPKHLDPLDSKISSSVSRLEAIIQDIRLNYQPKGNYQPAGNYITSSELSKLATKVELDKLKEIGLNSNSLKVLKTDYILSDQYIETYSEPDYEYEWSTILPYDDIRVNDYVIISVLNNTRYCKTYIYGKVLNIVNNQLFRVSSLFKIEDNFSSSYIDIKYNKIKEEITSSLNSKITNTSISSETGNEPYIYVYNSNVPKSTSQLVNISTPGTIEKYFTDVTLNSIPSKEGDFVVVVFDNNSLSKKALLFGKLISFSASTKEIKVQTYICIDNMQFNSTSEHKLINSVKTELDRINFWAGAKMYGDALGLKYQPRGDYATTADIRNLATKSELDSKANTRDLDNKGDKKDLKNIDTSLKNQVFLYDMNTIKANVGSLTAPKNLDEYFVNQDLFDASIEFDYTEIVGSETILHSNVKAVRLGQTVGINFEDTKYLFSDDNILDNKVGNLDLSVLYHLDYTGPAKVVLVCDKDSSMNMTLTLNTRVLEFTETSAKAGRDLFEKDHKIKNKGELNFKLKKPATDNFASICPFKYTVYFLYEDYSYFETKDRDYDNYTKYLNNPFISDFNIRVNNVTGKSSFLTLTDIMHKQNTLFKTSIVNNMLSTGKLNKADTANANNIIFERFNAKVANNKINSGYLMTQENYDSSIKSNNPTYKIINDAFDNKYLYLGSTLPFDFILDRYIITTGVYFDNVPKKNFEVNIFVCIDDDSLDHGFSNKIETIRLANKDFRNDYSNNVLYEYDNTYIFNINNSLNLIKPYKFSFFLGCESLSEITLDRLFGEVYGTMINITNIPSELTKKVDNKVIKYAIKHDNLLNKSDISEIIQLRVNSTDDRGIEYFGSIMSTEEYNKGLPYLISDMRPVGDVVLSFNVPPSLFKANTKYTLKAILKFNDTIYLDFKTNSVLRATVDNINSTNNKMKYIGKDTYVFTHEVNIANAFSENVNIKLCNAKIKNSNGDYYQSSMEILDLGIYEEFEYKFADSFNDEVTHIGYAETKDSEYENITWLPVKSQLSLPATEEINTNLLDGSDYQFFRNIGNDFKIQNGVTPTFIKLGAYSVNNGYNIGDKITYTIIMNSNTERGTFIISSSNGSFRFNSNSFALKKGVRRYSYTVDITSQMISQSILNVELTFSPVNTDPFTVNVLGAKVESGDRYTEVLPMNVNNDSIKSIVFGKRRYAPASIANIIPNTSAEVLSPEATNGSRYIECANNTSGKDLSFKIKYGAAVTNFTGAFKVIFTISYNTINDSEYDLENVGFKLYQGSSYYLPNCFKIGYNKYNVSFICTNSTVFNDTTRAGNSFVSISGIRTWYIKNITVSDVMIIPANEDYITDISLTNRNEVHDLMGYSTSPNPKNLESYIWIPLGGSGNNEELDNVKSSLQTLQSTVSSNTNEINTIKATVENNSRKLSRLESNNTAIDVKVVQLQSNLTQYFESVQNGLTAIEEELSKLR